MSRYFCHVLNGHGAMACLQTALAVQSWHSIQPASPGSTGIPSTALGFFLSRFILVLYCFWLVKDDGGSILFVFFFWFHFFPIGFIARFKTGGTGGNQGQCKFCCPWRLNTTWSTFCLLCWTFVLFCFVHARLFLLLHFWFLFLTDGVWSFLPSGNGSEQRHSSFTIRNKEIMKAIIGYLFFFSIQCSSKTVSLNLCGPSG